MNSETKLMIKTYETNELDWMGDKIKSPSDLTVHHIIKKEHGGENKASNYALLSQNSHRLLHYFEQYYPKEYNELNNMFLALNRSGKPPNVEYYKAVRAIVKRLCKKIKNENRSRGKGKLRRK